MDHPLSDELETFAAHARVFLRRNLSWFLCGALALLLLQDIFGTHGLIAMRRSHREATQVQKEIDQINEENRQLQDRVKNLKSDPQTIEQIAREEMGLARPGEYIFKTTPKSGDSSNSGAAPANQANKP